MPLLAGPSRKGGQKRRLSVLAPSYLTAFVMHLALSTGFTPIVWTAPQRDAMHLRSRWGPRWIPGHCEGLEIVDRYGHVAGTYHFPYAV